MKNIVIPRPEEFDKKKRIFAREGNEKIHVVSDFDRTLTKAFVDGEKISSIISQLRKGDYLSEDYVKRAYELYDKYHPIEVDAKIPLEEKKKEMYTWWKTHKLLLIEAGLNIKDIKHIVDNGPLEFREGASDFFDLINNENIPLIIFSASGIGEAIPLYFKKINKLYDNVHIVSNSLSYDESGKAVSIKEPIIHVFNKGEIALAGFPIQQELKDKKNVILLGDSLGDLGMTEGFDYDNIIRIGFLNYEDEEKLEDYEEKFDVIITGDSDMNFVNDFMKEILE